MEYANIFATDILLLLLLFSPNWMYLTNACLHIPVIITK